MSSTLRSPLSLFGLALGCAALLLSASVSASPHASEASPSVSEELETQIDWLRRADRHIERWHLQVTIPDAGRPSDADLTSLTERLRRLAARGDLPKAEVLLRRVDHLRHLLTTGRVVKRHGLAPEAAPASLVASTTSRPDCAAAMTVEAGEWIVDPASTAGEGLWLQFTAPEDGTYVAHTVGSRADTLLERWTACNASQYAAMDDDGVGLRSRLVFPAKAGEVVRLRLRSSADDRVLVAIEKGAGGTMSGRVTIASTGEPVEGRSVTIYRVVGSSSSYETSTVTAADGTWRVAGLADGPYYAVVEAPYNSDLFGQIYDGVDCPRSSSCRGEGGTPILLEGSVENIDFALHYGAAISGRVLEAATGVAISGASVSARDLLGTQSDSDVTDAAGRYRLGGLLDGEVRVTASSAGHRDVRWPDVPCEGSSCSATDGAVVPVAVDTEVSDIDFELERLASIAGRVTRASDGEPLSGVDVRVFAADGSVVGHDFTDPLGGYLLGGLEAGTYHVQMSDGYRWLPRFWPDADCLSPPCDTIAGDPIEVGQGQAVDGIDIAVSALASISGRVVSSTTGNAVGSGYVTLYDATGRWVDNDFLFFGDYSIDRLYPRDVYAVFSGTGYVGEVFDDVPCDGCDPTLVGTPIVLAPDLEITDLDFEVDRLGMISGRVTKDGSGEPIPGVELRVFDAAGEAAGTAYTDDEGHYGFAGLSNGRYTVRTNSQLVMDELYDDLPCEGGCDPTTGMGIDVTVANEVTGIDFALTTAPRIRGQVMGPGGVVGLGTGRARLFDDTGLQVDSDFTYSNEGFDFIGLEPGTYHLLIDDFDRYLPEIVGHGPCVYLQSSCDPTLGSDLTVGLGEELVVDVEITLGGSIEGIVLDRDAEPVGTGSISVFDDAGRRLGNDSLSRDGLWRVDSLPAGDFTVLFRSYRHVDEWWMDVPLLDDCPAEPCDASVGTAVPVTLGMTTTGVDFTVETFGSIIGTVLDEATGDIVGDGYVELYDASGVRQEGDFVDGFGRFSFFSVEPGTYTLGIRNADGYLEQIHGGDVCDPDCDPTTGTPITAVLSTTLDVAFHVIAGPGVYGRVLDAATGRPLVGVGLDVWDDSGEHVMSTATDPLGRYRLLLGSGSFYLSTDTGSAHGDIVWPDVACPDGSAFAGLCDPMAGTAIVLPDHMPLTAIDLQLDGPPPSGLLFFGDFEEGLSGWTVP